MFALSWIGSGMPFDSQCLLLFFVAVPICSLLYKAYVESDLRKRDPQAYIRLKQMEEQEKQRKHESRMAGMKIGQTIGRWFLR